jgi:hypothetical protein
MKRYLGVLIPAVGFIVSAGFVAWVTGTYAPWFRPIHLVQDADIVLKLAMFLIGTLCFGVLTLGLLARRGERKSLPMVTMTVAAVAIGLLAAAYWGINSHSTLIDARVITLAHQAPYYAGSAFVAALGFLVATMAMTFRAMGDRRG